MMRTRVSRGVLTVLTVIALKTSAAAQTAPQDYPQWRGVNRDGSASAFTEPKAWPETLTPLWKVEVGAGYATPIVIGNRVYTHTRQGENEVMLALDGATGKILWQTPYAAPYKMNPATKNHGQGPKSTPLFYNGRLYTLGISGIVSAFQASDGKLLWQKPAPPVDPLYGTAMSPIADKSMVVFHVGGHDQGALTAYDAVSGEVKWSWNGDGPAYASPIITDLGGTRQLVTLTQQRVVALDAATGALLWQHPWVTRATNNSITPIRFGDNLIITGQDKGVVALKPVRQNNQWTVQTVWETPDVAMFMSNPVVVGDTLFGLSHRASGQYFALDLTSGKVLWLGEPRQAVNTAIVKAGETLFLLNEDAELIVAKSSRSGFEPVKRYEVATSSTWAQPTITGNRLFVKDVSTLAMFRLN
jgi:outer membrane protein assembly factor BamB